MDGLRPPAALGVLRDAGEGLIARGMFGELLADVGAVPSQDMYHASSMAMRPSPDAFHSLIEAPVYRPEMLFVTRERGFGRVLLKPENSEA